MRKINIIKREAQALKKKNFFQWLRNFENKVNLNAFG